MVKRLIYNLPRIGLLSPVSMKADVYNALCDVGHSTSINENSSIEVMNCKITTTEEGFSVPIDFIPKDNISQWYSVLQQDNLILSVVSPAEGTYTGALAGLAECGASIRCTFLYSSFALRCIWRGSLSSQASNCKFHIFMEIIENVKILNRSL